MEQTVVLVIKEASEVINVIVHIGYQLLTLTIHNALLLVLGHHEDGVLFIDALILNGQDELTGGSGADSFLWLVSDFDGKVDQVLDFVLGEDNLEFKVSSSMAAAPVDEWLMFEVVNGSTMFSIDLDHDGDFSNATQFAELSDVTIESLSDISILVG